MSRMKKDEEDDMTGDELVEVEFSEEECFFSCELTDSTDSISQGDDD